MLVSSQKEEMGGLHRSLVWVAKEVSNSMPRFSPKQRCSKSPAASGILLFSY